AAIQKARCEPDTFGAAALQLVQNLEGLSRLEAMRQRQNQKLPVGERQEIIKLQMTFALCGIFPSFALGEQLAEPAVGGAGARIDQNVRRGVHTNVART